MAHAVGRVVRWDTPRGVGAVVVEGLVAEIAVSEDAVEVPAERDLQPGELVDGTYERGATGYAATRVCPTDAEP